MKTSVFVGVCALALMACGESEGEGGVVLRASGGNEAREGIAAASFADGYAVTLEHAYLSVTSVTFRAERGAEATLGFEPTVVDLVPEPALVLEAAGLEARRYDDVTYVVGPPPSTDVRGPVDTEVVARMVSERLGFLLVGTFVAPAGTQNAEGDLVTTVPFEFGFPVEATYARCGNGDRTFGLVVPTNSRADAEISWHLEHTFFDSYAEDASLRAEALVAAWDGDGPLTIADLASQRLSNLRGVGGGPLVDAEGYPVVYLPGATGARTLDEFVLAARFGHFGGLEGACTTSLRSTAP